MVLQLKPFVFSQNVFNLLGDSLEHQIKATLAGVSGEVLATAHIVAHALVTPMYSFP